MTQKPNNRSRSQKDAPRTRRAIIHLLKQEGAMDAQSLAEQLGISAMAVRQHLYALQAEHLIAYREEPRPMGRPAKLWYLTPAANRFFPEGYAELTLSLVQSVAEAFGNEGLDRLLKVRTRQQIEAYRAQIQESQQWQERVAVLADIRTHEGYMADVQLQADGSVLLIEKHCPICTVATTCTGLCSEELTVFRAVLGREVTVERTEHLVSGDQRCAYKITPNSDL